MAIVVESSASNTATASTSLTITKPSGTVSGDVLVAFVNMVRSSAINTPPSGWTTIEASGAYAYSHVYWKVAGASEPSSYTWDEGVSTNWAGVIFRLSGVDPTTQLDAATVTGEDTVYNTSFTCASITTVTDGSIVFASVFRDVRYITAGPGGAWTDGYLNAAAPGVGVAYQTLSTAGASGVATFTANTSDRSEYVALAFRPAADETVLLVVGDSNCLVASESPALTQHQIIAVADSACVVASESPTLVQHHVITVADCACIVTSDSPSLTQHQVLAVSDSECVVTSDEPTLTQHPVGSLEVQNSACAVTSDSPTLTQHHVLSVGDAACVVASDEPTLTAHNGVALVPADSQCVVTSDLVVLTQHHLLAVLDSKITVTSDMVTLGGVGYEPTVHYHTLEGPSKQIHSLVGPSAAYHTLEGPSKQIRILKGG